MKVAVLTLTRDRLDYTKHCFATLRNNAGCGFDHFVYDNGSTDGSREWLLANNNIADMIASNGNDGICPALNRLLALATGHDDYDAIVRYDNDCEVITPGTLAAVCNVAIDHDAIVAPTVNRLNHPPAVVNTYDVNGARFDQTMILGGIFMAIPAHLFTEHGYRYDETSPPWTGDEAIVPWWTQQGGICGYLRSHEVNHYERVDEQRDKLPGYQDRKDREIAAVAA